MKIQRDLSLTFRPERAWHRLLFLALGVALVAALLSLPAAAFASAVFPDVIPLPNGFAPEGIAIGRGTTFYTGSLATGAVYQGDLRTGQGSVLVPPQTGRISVGMKLDSRTNYLYVAGGTTGQGYVYSASTGETVAVFEFSTGGSFINDVIVTRTAAYFTDSFQPRLYAVDLAQDGSLPDPVQIRTITLGGEFNFIPGGFNANGIAATANGEWLVIVQSSTGALYRVDPDTGDAVAITGVSTPNGDGILLHGTTLYVVQNRLNQIAVIALDPTLTSGELTQTITSPNFRIPTTVAEFGDALYVVNARFGTPVTPDTQYEAVRVEK